MFIGIMACPRSVTSDGLEQQMGVNHIGHFLLTTLLLPVLESSGSAAQPSRVVNVSSMANALFGGQLDFTDFNADKSYDAWLRYGDSKCSTIENFLT